MGYIDGFVLAVPTESRNVYIAYARAVGAVFLQHGALRMVEGWGDDVPHGTLTDFHRAVKAEPAETVLFAWIEWPSKEVRDAVHAQILADPKMQEIARPMPFDGTRMIFGGFIPVVDMAQGG
jgi:uncharacterized protein YbaA (DUF1428 family)